MSQLVFDPPGKEAPGFLRRAREALSFQEAMQEKPTVAALDGMVKFLLDYVSEPKDKDEAREILMDASEEQFINMLASLSGESAEEDPT